MIETNHRAKVGSPAAVPVAWIEFALAMGGFAICAGELAVMGMVPQLSTALGVSAPQVGHVISAYALGVVVGAPSLTILAARVARKRLLLGLTGVYLLASLASALVPGYIPLLLARFIAGLPHGAYFGVATTVAASMVPPDKRAAAVSRVVLGSTLAMLLGMPLCSYVAHALGWRFAYGLVALLAAIAMVLIAIFLPRSEQSHPSSPLSEWRAFNRPQAWLGLAIGGIGFAGLFALFSYLAPMLLYVTQVPPYWIPIALAIFGIGAVGGNLFGGWLFDRLQFSSIAWLLGWSALVLLLFPLALHARWSMLLGVLAAGTMLALSPTLQTHLMDVARGAPALASASNQAAFNVANALGPWLGGLAISAGLGWAAPAVVGAGTCVIALGIFFYTQRLARA